MKIYKEIEHNGKTIEIPFCQEEEAFKLSEAAKYIIDSKYIGVNKKELSYPPFMLTRYKIPVNTPVEITQFVAKIYADYSSLSSVEENIKIIEKTEEYVIFEVITEAICNAMVKGYYGELEHGCWFHKNRDKIEEILDIPEIKQSIKRHSEDNDERTAVAIQIENAKKYGLDHHCADNIIDCIAFYHKVGDTTAIIEENNDNYYDEVIDDIISEEKSGNMKDVCAHSDIDRPILMDLNGDDYVLYILTHED